MRGDGVLRFTAFGVHRRGVYRRADAQPGELTVAQGEDLRLGQHHMMILLVQRLLIRQFTIGGHANRAGMQDHGVLFVDGQPERNFGGKFAEQQPGIAHECLPGFAVQPAAF